MTRSREDDLARGPPNKKKKKNEHHWEWHAECERSDVRDVLRHMRSILT
jgi:hypothetical protein